ncbi:MAG TPA: TetR/AcrR family transcriptional regulator [Actinocrinis sp.]|nr:TetR/AcrR family transcriptional regulator [Actinocrinis sp.]
MSSVSPRQADPALAASLVEAAARLLAQEGPVALTTRRLAADVGSSTMAVYTHFGGMDDLVRAVVHEGFERLNGRMTAVGATDDPVADVAALGRAYRQNALDHRAIYTVMFGGSSLAGFSLTDDDRQYGRFTLEILVGGVLRCIEAGRFRQGDAQLIAHQMWIALHGLVTLELGGYLTEPYSADACFEAQVCGLMVGAGDSVEAATRSVQRVQVS